MGGCFLEKAGMVMTCFLRWTIQLEDIQTLAQSYHMPAFGPFCSPGIGSCFRACYVDFRVLLLIVIGIQLGQCSGSLLRVRCLAVGPVGQVRRNRPLADQSLPSTRSGVNLLLEARKRFARKRERKIEQVRARGQHEAVTPALAPACPCGMCCEHRGDDWLCFYGCFMVSFGG